MLLGLLILNHFKISINLDGAVLLLRVLNLKVFMCILLCCLLKRLGVAWLQYLPFGLEACSRLIATTRRIFHPSITSQMSTTEH